MFQAMSLVVLVTTYSLMGLVAVWGAMGRGHWFWRVAAVLLGLSVWLAAPDDAFWVAFLVQSVIVIATIGLVRSFRPRRERASDAPRESQPIVPARPHFTLADLLLLMLLAGATLAILARVRPGMQSRWLPAIGAGAAFALLTLASVEAAFSRFRLRIKLPLLTLLLPISPSGAWLWLARSARTRFGRMAAAACLLLLAAPPVGFYAWLIAPRFMSLPAPLADNGVDDLFRAAEALTKPAIDLTALSDEAVADYLGERREVLESARAGLRRPCQMPLFSGAVPDQADIDRSSSLRQLGRAFAADARLQMRAGRPREAAQCALDAVRLGEAMSHSCTMLDAQIGVACQMTGLEELRQLLPQLDAAECRELGARLAEIEKRQETHEQIAAREETHFAKTAPWHYRWTVLQLKDFTAQGRKATAASLNTGLARLRLFRCHLALREFWLAHGEYPAALAELAPDVLAELPRDPCGGGEFVYRRLPAGYQLYSVGPDGIDDGGRPVPPGGGAGVPAGDIVLDVELEPGRE